MSYNNQLKKYNRDNSIVFRMTKENFGGLSNMASGYPISINGYFILSSEALYQAIKFTDSNIQKEIIFERSPMTAKMKSKKYNKYIRSDWDDIKVPVMKWCIRLKLINNWGKFGMLLKSTGNLDIVEESMKDTFWGAKPIDNSNLVGQNYLGRLLKMIREEYKLVNEKKNYILPQLKGIDLIFMDSICPEFKIEVSNQKNENLKYINSLQNENFQLSIDTTIKE